MENGLVLPIVTDRLYLRQPLLAGMFRDILLYDDFYSYMGAHPEAFQLFERDTDTVRIFDITRKEGFYFSRIKRSDVSSSGARRPSFFDVSEFIWTLCREAEMSPYKSIGLMVVRKGEVAPCGHVRLCDIDWERGTALRSVFTDPDLQRQGIAKEALMELTYGGFTKLGLREVLIRVDPNNTRSISNILKNFSARFVGETQARVAAEEGLHRRHLYSLDRDHFLQFIYPRFVSAQKIRASLSHQFQGHAEDGADYHHFPSCTPDH